MVGAVSSLVEIEGATRRHIGYVRTGIPYELVACRITVIIPKLFVPVPHSNAYVCLVGEGGGCFSWEKRGSFIPPFKG